MLDLLRAIREADPPTLAAHLSAAVATRVLLIPKGARIVWNAEILVSVDGKPAVKVMEVPWNSTVLQRGGTPRGLLEVMGPGSFTEGPHRLSFSAEVTRYPGSVRPETMAESVFVTFPPDFPRVVMSDDQIDGFLEIRSMELVTVIFPPRAGRCIQFKWPGDAAWPPETVCLPPGDLSLRDRIVAFDLTGGMTLDQSHPIAMTGSVSIVGADEPVMSFDLAGLACSMAVMGPTWHIAFPPGNNETTSTWWLASMG